MAVELAGVTWAEIGLTTNMINSSERNIYDKRMVQILLKFFEYQKKYIARLRVPHPLKEWSLGREFHR